MQRQISQDAVYVKSCESRKCPRAQWIGLFVFMLLMFPGLGICEEDTAVEVSSQAQGQKLFADLQREALEAEEPTMRIAALKMLFERQSEGKVLPVFVTALQDKEVTVRAIALQLMEQLENELLPLDTIAELTRTDPSPPLRVHAFLVLTDKAKEAALEPLKRGLQDPDPYVREQVERLLEDMGQKPRDAQKEAEAIERFKADAIKSGLLQSLQQRLLHNPDPQARAAMQQFLRKIGEEPAKETEKGNQDPEQVKSHEEPAKETEKGNQDPEQVKSQ